mmetsp:Transcript_27935/g.78138  ORF Transcript_27935/g.78138 Transcript_27935/m.78138 type:complete len:262 (+) Transcript_27935:6185-6970(+)
MRVDNDIWRKSRFSKWHIFLWPYLAANTLLPMTTGKFVTYNWVSVIAQFDCDLADRSFALGPNHSHLLDIRWFRLSIGFNRVRAGLFVVKAVERGPLLNVVPHERKTVQIESLVKRTVGSSNTVVKVLFLSFLHPHRLEDPRIDVRHHIQTGDVNLLLQSGDLTHDVHHLPGRYANPVQSDDILAHHGSLRLMKQLNKAPRNESLFARAVTHDLVTILLISAPVCKYRHNVSVLNRDFLLVLTLVTLHHRGLDLGWRAPAL